MVAQWNFWLTPSISVFGEPGLAIRYSSLHRDYLPSSWGMFRPTVWDYLTFLGSIGMFLCLFLLFIRLLPMISISEMRALLPGTHATEEGR